MVKVDRLEKLLCRYDGLLILLTRIVIWAPLAAHSEAFRRNILDLGAHDDHYTMLLY